MPEFLSRFADRVRIDWHLFVPAFLLSLAGLVTMDSFSGDNYFFARQAMWILVAVMVFFVSTSIDWRFLRRTEVLMPIFVIVTIILLTLFGLGHVSKGAASWFRLGFVGFQPSDIAKLTTILILAKYFSRRHVELRE